MGVSLSCSQSEKGSIAEWQIFVREDQALEAAGLRE